MCVRVLGSGGWRVEQSRDVTFAAGSCDVTCWLAKGWEVREKEVNRISFDMLILLEQGGNPW